MAEPGPGLRDVEQRPCLGDGMEVHGPMCSHPWGQVEESTAQCWSSRNLPEPLCGPLPPNGQRGQEHGTTSLSQTP